MTSKEAMFIDKTRAHQIEQAEAQMMRDMVGELVGSLHAPAAFVTELEPGIATYVRRESPCNKLIGAGMDTPIDRGRLDDIEVAFHRNSEPVRAEVSTLADPRTFAQLAQRGYRLLGFENVLARSLVDAPPALATEIAIERVTAATLEAFRSTVIEAAACPDDTGIQLDTFSRDVIATAVEDSLSTSRLMRYVAYHDGEIAGAASMSVQRGIAILAGSGTLAAQRRRGVHAALLAKRLTDARAAGAVLAIVTTGPGTQSQANMMKLGFSLAYARAVLALPC